MIIHADFTGTLFEGARQVGTIISQSDVQYEKIRTDPLTGKKVKILTPAWKLQFIAMAPDVNAHFRKRGFQVLYWDDQEIFIAKPILD
jgi:hypothetical protein